MRGSNEADTPAKDAAEEPTPVTTEKPLERGVETSAKTAVPHRFLGRGGGRAHQGDMESFQLFVGDLAKDMTEGELESAFSTYGTVVSVEIKRDKETNNNLGYGFVQMATPDEAYLARDKLNGTEVCGRAIRIGWAQKNTTLFVGDLDDSVTDQSLLDLFSQYGEIVPHETFVRIGSEPHIRFGFVRFIQREDAEKAKASLHGRPFGATGRLLRIGWGDNRIQFHCVHVQFDALEAEGKLTEGVLHEYFSQFGPVTGVALPRAAEDGALKGFAFISYEDTQVGEKAAANAIEETTNTENIASGLTVKCAYGKQHGRRRFFMKTPMRGSKRRHRPRRGRGGGMGPRMYNSGAPFHPSYQRFRGRGRGRGRGRRYGGFRDDGQQQYYEGPGYPSMYGQGPYKMRGFNAPIVVVMNPYQMGNGMMPPGQLQQIYHFTAPPEGGPYPPAFHPEMHDMQALAPPMAQGRDNSSPSAQESEVEWGQYDGADPHTFHDGRGPNPHQLQHHPYAGFQQESQHANPPSPSANPWADSYATGGVSGPQQSQASRFGRAAQSPIIVPPFMAGEVKQDQHGGGYFPGPQADGQVQELIRNLDLDQLTLTHRSSNANGDVGTSSGPTPHDQSTSTGTPQSGEDQLSPYSPPEESSAERRPPPSAFSPAHRSRSLESVTAQHRQQRAPSGDSQRSHSLKNLYDDSERW